MKKPNLPFRYSSLPNSYTHAFSLSRDIDDEYMELISDLLKHDDKLGILKETIHHSDITIYEHVRCVSYISYKICKRLGLDYKAAARAGFLHDLVYYDWHDPDPAHKFHGYRHPGFAVKNAKELTMLTPLEENIIHRHMWPLTPVPPKYKEAWVVTLVDKYCAAKETARKYQKQPSDYRGEQK